MVGAARHGDRRIGNTVSGDGRSWVPGLAWLMQARRGEGEKENKEQDGPISAIFAPAVNQQLLIRH
jgi:hypothetical protein